MTNIIKNIFILLLLLLSLYLTWQLWFEEISNVKFFNNITSEFKTNKNENLQKQATISPYRIVTSLGNNRYTIKYSNIINSPEKEICDLIIKSILNNGIYIEETSYYYYLLKNYKYYSYEYPFEFETNSFLKSFNINNSKLNSNVDSFSSILIYLSDEEDIINAIFVSKDTSYKYKLNDSELYNLLSLSFENKTQLNNKLIYTFENSTNSFTAIEYGYNYVANEILIENKYEINGQVGFESVKKLIGIFINPRLTQERRIQNSYTFIDNNIFVKYYTNNILEYFNYNSNNKIIATNFLDDYQTAIEFLMKDYTITNEYYLSGYSITEDGIEFYFDYVVNNFNILLDDEVKSFTGMNNIIEISVSNGQVTRYKKIVYEFKPDRYNYINKSDILNKGILNYVLQIDGKVNLR